LSEQAMAQLYCHADAFVLPSLGEGWGLPLAEAMAIGLPTIGTRWGGPLVSIQGRAHVVTIVPS